jgi:hypothetical protein
MVHIRMVVTARPFLMRPVHMLIVSKRILAMPDRSSIVPMKMKSGTAART